MFGLHYTVYYILCIYIIKLFTRSYVYVYWFISLINGTSELKQFFNRFTVKLHRTAVCLIWTQFFSQGFLKFHWHFSKFKIMMDIQFSTICMTLNLCIFFKGKPWIHLFLHCKKTFKHIKKTSRIINYFLLIIWPQSRRKPKKFSFFII